MLKQYLLRRTQKKQVFDLLRESGLQPADFVWNKEDVGSSLVVSRLTHRYADYYFQFSWLEMNAWCRFCPGEFRLEDSEHPRTWAEQIACFTQWAGRLKQDLDCPDVWDYLDKYRLVMSVHLAEQLHNEAISAYEAQDIDRHLGSLAEKLVTELDLNTGDSGFVLSRIGYLADAAKRQRSADWIYTTLGVCLTIAATLSLSEQDARAVWQHFENEIGQVIKLQPM